MSHCIPAAAEVLNCAVLRCHPGSGDLLDEDDEDEHAEDSDYENEPEPTDELVSGNVHSGEKLEQRLFPVLRIGSSVA